MLLKTKYPYIFLRAKVYRSMTSGCQRTPCFRRYDWGLVLKPTIALKKVGLPQNDSAHAIIVYCSNWAMTSIQAIPLNRQYCKSMIEAIPRNRQLCKSTIQAFPFNRQLCKSTIQAFPFNRQLCKSTVHAIPFNRKQVCIFYI